MGNTTTKSSSKTTEPIYAINQFFRRGNTKKQYSPLYITTGLNGRRTLLGNRQHRRAKKWLMENLHLDELKGITTEQLENPSFDVLKYLADVGYDGSTNKELIFNLRDYVFPEYKIYGQGKRTRPIYRRRDEPSEKTADISPVVGDDEYKWTPLNADGSYKFIKTDSAGNLEYTPSAGTTISDDDYLDYKDTYIVTLGGNGPDDKKIPIRAHISKDDRQKMRRAKRFIRHNKQLFGISKGQSIRQWAYDIKDDLSNMKWPDKKLAAAVAALYPSYHWKERRLTQNGTIQLPYWKLAGSGEHINHSQNVLKSDSRHLTQEWYDTGTPKHKVSSEVFSSPATTIQHQPEFAMIKSGKKTIESVLDSNGYRQYYEVIRDPDGNIVKSIPYDFIFKNYDTDSPLLIEDENNTETSFKKNGGKMNYFQYFK